MPIFEFICQECGRPFEELVRSAGVVAEVVCPDCGSPQVKKKISTFAARVVGTSSGGAALSSSACSTGSV
ncbi:MAG TPA: zinc ribbon domain-containing protein [Anaerolineales bacterium]